MSAPLNSESATVPALRVVLVEDSAMLRGMLRRQYRSAARRECGGSELVNFSVTPAEEGASGFVTAVAAR